MRESYEVCRWMVTNETSYNLVVWSHTSLPTNCEKQIKSELTINYIFPQNRLNCIDYIVFSILPIYLLQNSSFYICLHGGIMFQDWWNAEDYIKHFTKTGLSANTDGAYNQSNFHWFWWNIQLSVSSVFVFFCIGHHSDSKLTGTDRNGSDYQIRADCSGRA